ncbi:hypothetical protein ACFDR9_005170 [Janthinobacterium sp. CG_23.3]|uniref:hypothetical protein n=1 Tax=unclassified Janthinobacterium TaxID=2610881 RepID=UPI002E0CCE93|nr:hypothetical protein [Janthinobacterium sp. CG_S6]
MNRDDSFFAGAEMMGAAPASSHDAPPSAVDIEGRQILAQFVLLDDRGRRTALALVATLLRLKAG